MKRAVIISAIVAVSLGVSTLAVQAKGMGPKGGMPLKVEFSELDLNGDGQISQEEMQALGEKRFVDADADGDGFLTLEEMKADMMKKMEARFEKRGAKMMERKDADGDGKLSLEEMRPKGKRQDKMFGRIDTDGDGMISEEEFKAAQERLAERRQHRMGKDGKRSGKVEN